MMQMNLSLVDLLAMAPLLLMLVSAGVLLVLEAFFPKVAKALAVPLLIFTIVAAFFATIFAPSPQSSLITHWVSNDLLTKFFTLLFLSIGLAFVLLSSAFYKKMPQTGIEYYILLIATLYGLSLIVASTDFLTLFLGLETLSIALYILCGYIKKSKLSQEAAFKYFLMGATAASFLAYGIALIYGAVGTTNFSELREGYLKIESQSDSIVFFAGIAFITLGIAFKAAVVPFHFWAPDVYEGASTPVTSFMATGVKVGAFAAFLRVFYASLGDFNPLWNQGLIYFTFLTLIVANFMALYQNRLKRFFAYSGIAHAGFLLIPLVVNSADTFPATAFYLTVYSLATFGAFAVLSFVDEGHRGETIHDLYGLFYRSPKLAIIFCLSLLTLAGLPPTAGFFAKFYIFKIAFQAGYNGLVIVGLLTTILSAYYYLRLVVVMFSLDTTPKKIKSFWEEDVVAFAAFVGLVLLSIFPGHFFSWLS